MLLCLWCEVASNLLESGEFECSSSGARGRRDEDDASSMLLPDETYEQGAVVAGHLLAMLRVYDDFLARYRIRPEFFCR